MTNERDTGTSERGAPDREPQASRERDQQHKQREARAKAAEPLTKLPPG